MARKKAFWADNDQLYKSNILPTVVESEKKIREEAPLAVNQLKKHEAMDLLDVLGLAPYSKEE